MSHKEQAKKPKSKKKKTKKKSRTPADFLGGGSGQAVKALRGRRKKIEDFLNSL